MRFDNHAVIKVDARTREVSLVEYGYHNTTESFRAVSRLRGQEPPDSPFAYLNGPLADVYVPAANFSAVANVALISAGSVPYRAHVGEHGRVYSVVIVGDLTTFAGSVARSFPLATVHPRTRQEHPIDLPAALREAAASRAWENA